MVKLRILVICVFLICLILNGCSYDLAEVDEEVYPLALGADIGHDNKVRVTIQYPSYKEGGKGADGGVGMGSRGGQEEPDTGEVNGTIVVTVEASTILEAVNLLNTAVARTISLTHTKMLVFSEEFARRGIGEYLAPMMRYRETRRIMHVVVSRERAEDFIRQNRSLIGESASKAMELMVTQSQNNGLFPRVTFLDFYMDMLSTYQQPFAAYAGVNDFKNLADGPAAEDPPLNVREEFLPGELPRRGASRREFIGTAVFDGARMVGTLNSFETRCLMLINGEFKRGIMTIEDKNAPGKAIPLDIRLGRRPKIRAHFENGTPVIDVNLNIEADLGAIQSRINYERLNRIGELNSMIEDYLEDGINKVIEKTQKELNADVFGFGKKIAARFSTIQEWEEYNWIAHYKEARVNVSVEANIRRTGLMFASFPIRSTAGAGEGMVGH